MKETYFTNEFTIFSNENLGSLQALTTENGEPWFIGRSVADILNIKAPNSAYKRLAADEKKTVTVIENNERTLTGVHPHKMVIVSESGLYGMIMASRKKEAREFQKWVTHEVLPSIRRSGGYIIGQEKLPPAERAELEEKLKALADKNKKLRQKNRTLAKSNERLQKRRHELIRDNKQLLASGKYMKTEIGKREELLDIYERLEAKQIDEYSELLSENKRLKESLPGADDVSRAARPAHEKKEALAKSHEYFFSPDGMIYESREELIRERQGR